MRKLTKLYEGPLFMKEPREPVVNLSSSVIDPDILNIMSLGFNCHLKHKFDRVKQKVSLELLYENVRDKCSQSKVIIHNEENFKSELERFGTKAIVDRSRDLLTKQQRENIKIFN